MWEKDNIKNLRQENISLKSKMSSLEEEIMRLQVENNKIQDVKKAKVEANTILYQIVDSMQKLVSSLNEDEVMKAVEKLLEKGCKVNEFQIFQVNESKNILKCILSFGKRSEKFKNNEINLDNDSLITWAFKNRQFISVDNLSPSLVGLKNKGDIPSILSAPLNCEGDTIGVINITSFYEEKNIDQDVKKLIRMLSNLIGFVLKNAKAFTNTQKQLETAAITNLEKDAEKKKLEEVFSKYVSEGVAEQILNNAEFLSLGGQRQIVTVLFADIRSFTKMAEKLDPEEIVSILNECLTEVTEIILKYGGTLDKYIGDAVMAIFGAPVSMTDDVEKCVLASIEIQKRLKVLQQKWMIEGKEKLTMGIGINTGEVIIGNIGSERRMDYTAIGDNVNIAARLEECAKSGEIIISESTYNVCRDIVKIKKNEPVLLKGKSLPLQTYKILGVNNNIDVNQYCELEVDTQAVTMQYTQRVINKFATSKHKVRNISDSNEKKWAKGIKLATKKEYDKALEIFLEIIKDEPKNAKYYFSVGLVYFKIKKLKKAVMSFQKTLKLEKDHKEAKSMYNKCKQIAEARRNKK